MSQSSSPENLTIAEPTKGFYKEKGSKFYAYAYPLAKREAVDERLAEVQAEYPDARHIVYAWRIGDDMHASDAGEPANSSGPPVLRQIQSHELTHAMCIVVRYFGGVKLGVSGLIRAYGAAAAEALAAAERVPYVELSTLRFSYHYDDTAAIERLLREFEVEILDTEYTATCRAHVQLPTAQAQALVDALANQAFEIERTD